MVDDRMDMLSRMPFLVHRVGAGEKAAKDLTDAEAREAAHLLLSGEATLLQAGGFLVGMRIKTEAPDEMSAFSSVCREYNRPFDAGTSLPLDIPVYAGKKTFFHAIIPAAFLISAVGQPVFLHGFSGVTGRVGVGATLSALGVPVDLAADEASARLKRFGFVYWDVAQFNPPLYRFHLFRNELGVRTIFNAIARTSNPSSASCHLIGVSHPPYLDLTLETLRRMGSSRALVLRGVEGGPEPSATSETKGILMNDGQQSDVTLSPTQIGFPLAARADVSGGDAGAQAARVLGILDGTIAGPLRHWTLLTAATGLWAAGCCTTLQEGFEAAEAQLVSGGGLKKLQQALTASSLYTQTNQVCETIPKEMRRGDGSVAPTSETSSQT